MTNLHTLVVGRTGTGKTVLARVLVSLAARVVILDRKMEYNSDEIRACYTLRDAVDYFLTNRWSAFKLALRSRDPADYFRLIEIVQHTQRVEPHGPMVIVMEEASAYSTTHDIHPLVMELYNAGRHERISLLTIIQRDTSIHPLTRANSELIVSMKQSKLSGDMQGYFGMEEVERLTSVKEDFASGRFRAGDWPEQGRHFLVYPDDTDLYETWIAHHSWIARNAK